MQVNLKVRADGNSLTNVSGWDFRLETCITQLVSVCQAGTLSERGCIETSNQAEK